MHRYLITLAVSLVLTASAWTQESEPEDGADQPVDPVLEVPADVEETDDSDLDDQAYSDVEEDVFIPSEDVQSDQSISFPTDI